MIQRIRFTRRRIHNSTRWSQQCSHLQKSRWCHNNVNSTELLGSKDVTAHMVTLLPEQPLDFAHNDLFWVDSAQTEVWEPIYNWVRTL